jgi:hypothetical protein
MDFNIKTVSKITADERPNILDRMIDGKMQWIINTPVARATNGGGMRNSKYFIVILHFIIKALIVSHFLCEKTVPQFSDWRLPLCLVFFMSFAFV